MKSITKSTFRCPDCGAELPAELVERARRVVLPALDLDGDDVPAAADLRLREQEVDLHPVLRGLAAGVRVEVEFAPGRAKHLRDDVLIQIPEKQPKKKG